MSAPLGRKFILPLVAIWLLISSSSMFAERVCCEGENWLTWTSAERHGYVFAYELGYSTGFGAGCDEGTRNTSAAQGNGLERDPARNCHGKAPDFSKGPDYFVEQITRFYTRYPQDRDLYISELIQCFARGLSVDQTYLQHFPSRQKSDSKP